MRDHSSFIFTLNETAKLCQPKEKIRSYRKFDIDNFKMIPTKFRSATSLYTQYHSTMLTLLDKHAPLKSCKVTPNARPVNEWITDEILLSERKKRQLERLWGRDRTDSNRSRFNAQVHLKAKKNYYTTLVSENITNPINLWDKMKYILHKKQTIYFRIVHAIPNLLALSVILLQVRSLKSGTLCCQQNQIKTIILNLHLQLSQILYSVSHKYQKVTCQSLFSHHPANHVT